MTKVCISGYYGFDNAGDEAILLSMIQELRANFEGIEIVVLSDKPEKTAETYGVEAYNRWKWMEIHKALKSSDMLISGGGGLLQDVTGKKSLLYYTNIMRMARHRRKPVFIFAQGIGPVNSKWGQDAVVKALRKATKITVRDEESSKMLQSWGLRRGRIRVTADPVLLLGKLERIWDPSRFVEILDPSRFDADNINANNETEIEICLVDQATLNNILAENAAKVEAESSAAKAVAEEAAQENQEAAEEIRAESATEEDAPKEEIIVVAELPEGTEIVEADEDNSDEVAAEDAAEEIEEKPIENYEEYGLFGKHPNTWKEEGENLAIFSIRDYTGFPVEDIAKAADTVAEAGYKIVFLPFQYPNDVEISQKVVDEMEYVAELFDAKTPLTPQEILTVMDEADFVFGMRLHSLVMAAITKTPFASLSYNPKVQSFVNQLGLTVTGDLEDYDREAFFAALDDVLAAPEAVAASIDENLDELVEKAEFTMDLMHTLLDRIQRRANRKGLTREERETLGNQRRTEREAFREEMHLYDTPADEQETAEVEEPTIEIIEESYDDVPLEESSEKTEKE